MRYHNNGVSIVVLKHPVCFSCSLIIKQITCDCLVFFSVIANISGNLSAFYIATCEVILQWVADAEKY